MRQKQFSFSNFLLSVVVLFVWTTNAQAQQSTESHKWVVNAGPQLVQISSEGIHINQPDPKGLTYYGIVSSRINLPPDKPWKITFDLKFGQLRSAGVAIGLFAGPNLVGWVGADGWYKQMGCFVGKGNEVAAPSANTDWHKFQFRGDGQTVTIMEDGNVIGSGAQSGTPDTVKIGDINGSVQSAGAQPAKMLEGQQSELWVRNVRVSANEASSPSVDRHIQATDTPSVEKLKELRQGVQQPAAANTKSAVLAKSVTIKFVYGIAGYMTVGTLSQVPGIWTLTVTLQNMTDKIVWLIPNALEFDNKSLEVVLPIDGWHYMKDSRHVGGEGWGATMKAEYYTPTLPSTPYIELEPKTTSSFDVFAENGGSWAYVTQQRPNGYSSAPQQIPRNPKQLTFLQLPDSTDPNKPTLEARMASPFGFSPLPSDPYACNIELLRRVQRPPSSDSRWIIIPLSEIKPESHDTSHF